MFITIKKWCSSYSFHVAWFNCNIFKLLKKKWIKYKSFNMKLKDTKGVIRSDKSNNNGQRSKDKH